MHTSTDSCGSSSWLTSRLSTASGGTSISTRFSCPARRVYRWISSPTVACSRIRREINVVVDTASMPIAWNSSSLRGELTRLMTRWTSKVIRASWQET